MNFNIRIAQTEAELTELYQLRYKVYVEELNRTQKYANHKLKEIREPLDETAHNIIAVFDGKIVGSVRFSFRRETGYTYYDDIYKFNYFKKYYPDGISFVTKLIIASEFRKYTLATQLAVKCYELGGASAPFSFIDCYQHMVPFFLKLGYRFYTDTIIHPEYGKVIPLVVTTHDLKHLEKVGSAFLNISFPTNKQDTESIRFFSENFDSVHQQFLQSFQEEYQSTQSKY